MRGGSFTTFPYATICVAMSSTRSLGMANPMPGALPPSWGSVAASVGIPIARPSLSTSAPPELPGLIAALVWITDGSVTVPPLPGAPGGTR